jgi:hypothetical protein
MLIREEGTRGTGTPPVVKRLIWFTDGSRTAEGLTQTYISGFLLYGR